MLQGTGLSYKDDWSGTNRDERCGANFGTSERSGLRRYGLPADGCGGDEQSDPDIMMARHGRALQLCYPEE